MNPETPAALKDNQTIELFHFILFRCRIVLWWSVCAEADGNNALTVTGTNPGVVCVVLAVGTTQTSPLLMMCEGRQKVEKSTLFCVEVHWWLRLIEEQGMHHLGEKPWASVFIACNYYCPVDLCRLCTEGYEINSQLRGHLNAAP